jgi:hypothetical protein
MPPAPLAPRLTLAALVLASAAPGTTGPIVFTDATAAAGLDFVHFNGATGELYFSEMMGAGAALLDYDRDGDLDLYLVQGAMLVSGQDLAEATNAPRGEPIDRLYRNDLVRVPGGALEARLVDVTTGAGLREAGYGMGVAVGDVDNDGWSDLYVLDLGPNQLWRNRGDGTFEEAGAAAGVADRHWGVSAAFADLDRDGWLDLYVANYVDYSLATHKECTSPLGLHDYCGPLAFEPQPDALYRNRGDGTFENVSGRSGIAARVHGALGVVAFDANGDEWPDLYVANDQVPNTLWVNAGDGTFVDDSLLSGTSVSEAGAPEASMGVVAGDLDGDGDEDLFMSHITREGNTLYTNDGGGVFGEAKSESGLGMASWPFTGFGIGASDFDRDGRLDLFVANGAVNQQEELVARGDPLPLAQANLVLHNVGGGRWSDVTGTAGEALASRAVGRGLAQGDVDLDGDEDLVVGNNAGPAVLLRNDSPPGGGWLAASALTGPGGRFALGTRLRLTGTGSSLRRRVATDGSYASSSSPEAVFGLGTRAAPLALRADWPVGGASRWEGVPADRRLVLVPPGAVP